MNKDQVRGKVENLKGRAKEAAGAITGNKETQAEGTVERIKGAVREKVGQIKNDTARKIDSSAADDEDQDE
ncbi:MAG: CsbD-like [Myxococcales bacterium]|nr:CsbD-like [Myxococcales bacterium]